jgi:hypothetical protein
MVVQHNQFKMVQHVGPTHLGRPSDGDGGQYYNGERIEYRLGEPSGEAIKRHLAKKAEAAKSATALATPKPVAMKPTPVADPQIADLRKREGEVAKLQQTADAKQRIGKLEKQLTELQSRQTPKPRGFASRLKLGGEKFNAFKPNGTAA